MCIWAVIFRKCFFAPFEKHNMNSWLPSCMRRASVKEKQVELPPLRGGCSYKRIPRKHKQLTSQFTVLTTCSKNLDWSHSASRYALRTSYVWAWIHYYIEALTYRPSTRAGIVHTLIRRFEVIMARFLKSLSTSVSTCTLVQVHFLLGA